MKKVVLKTYGKIIAAILSFIGIMLGNSSCINDKTAPEYGIPNADFIVKGKVTDAANTAPINKIRIVVPKSYYPLKGDTVYTNANGEYEVKFNDFPNPNTTFKVIASDMDKEANGGWYVSDTLKIQFTDKDKIKNGEHWYAGTFQKTNQNFALKHETLAEYGVKPAPFKEK